MASTSVQLARRSLDFVRPYRRTLVGIVSLAVLLASLSAVDPLVMKYLFDQLARPYGAGLRTFAIAIGALRAPEVGRAWLQAWLGVLTWDVRLGVEYTVRERIVTKLNALPIAFHRREGVGGTMTRVDQAVTAFVSAFGDVAFAPLPAIIGARAAPEQMHRERRLVERWTSIYSRFNEVLAGIMTVKGYGMEDAERRRFLDGVREGNEVVRRGVRTDNRNGALRSLAATVARLAALAIGGVLVVQEEVTVGTLVAFLGYIGGLFGPVQGPTNTYQTLRRATVSLETIYGVLDADDPVGDAPDAADIPAVRGEVQFRDVSFGYQPGHPVLHGVDLTVRPGETVALVGPSGSGKSTLVTLLQRLYTVTGGSILLDGLDVRAMTQRSLRQQIGVVFQDAHLFNDTVRANIVYGKPDATPEEIETAARAAHAHEFITALPQGYDTVVSERGSRLSGGQRQRIAIARALLKNPPILVLDEATSALGGYYAGMVRRQQHGFLGGMETGGAPRAA